MQDNAGRRFHLVIVWGSLEGSGAFAVIVSVPMFSSILHEQLMIHISIQLLAILMPSTSHPVERKYFPLDLVHPFLTRSTLSV